MCLIIIRARHPRFLTSMFDNQNPNASQKLIPPVPDPVKPPVEDIFSQMDGGTKSPRPAVLEPKKTGNPAEAFAPETVDVFKKSMDAKRIILAGAGFLGLVLIFIGAWYSYNIFLPKQQETGKNQPATEANETNQPAENTAAGEDAQNGEEPAVPATETAGTLLGTDVLNNPLEPGGAEENGEAAAVDPGRDSDNDGLKDLEEAELGTDPKKIDSDDDGLFDNEEVGVYKTDPLNPDTDGDGFTDGSEVKNGYDPKGNGKLFEVIPAE